MDDGASAVAVAKLIPAFFHRYIGIEDGKNDY